MKSDNNLSAAMLACRASNADRERTVDVIKAAFAEGRLTQDECGERVSKALGSRTYSDLAGLTSDLPVGPLGVVTGAAVAPTTQSVQAFDWPDAVMSACSVALVVFLLSYPAPMVLLAAIILGVVACVRSRRRGPRWERLAIWGVSGVTAAGLIGLILSIFL